MTGSQLLQRLLADLLSFAGIVLVWLGLHYGLEWWAEPVRAGSGACPVSPEAECVIQYQPYPSPFRVAAPWLLGGCTLLVMGLGGRLVIRRRERDLPPADYSEQDDSHTGAS